MKTLKVISFIITIFVIIVSGSSCKRHENKKPSSSGKTCEILVVANEGVYKGSIEDTLKSFFMQYQEGLNQPEPLFTLPNIPVSSFENTGMFQAHRNIVLIELNDTFRNTFEIFKDLYSSPQLIFSFKNKTKNDFLKLFDEKKVLMLNAFNELERTRINAAFKAVEQVNVREEITKSFGFSLIVPEGFSVAKKTPDFMWIRKEAKDFGQGIIIHSFPYTNVKDLEFKRIIEKRDSITKLYIPGPTDGSYMTSEKEFKPYSKEINFNGIYTIETRGLWKVEGDFMGGPFINYTFVDEKNNRVIMLDGYLYSPRKPKRDLLKQLEAILYTYKPNNN
jgi:hypothetical protein